RMILRDGDPIELERQGGARERLDAPPVHDLGDALARITGRRDMSEGPSSTSLPGGAALWWARGADGRLCAALERPQAPAPALAEASQAGVLDDALALRLLGALGSGRPLLFAARPGAAEALALPLALALAAAGRRPGAL